MSAIYYLVRGKQKAEAKRFTEPTDRHFWVVFIDRDWKYETCITVDCLNGDPSMPPGDRWEIDELSPETSETTWIRRTKVSRESSWVLNADKRRERIRKKNARRGD